MLTISFRFNLLKLHQPKMSGQAVLCGNAEIIFSQQEWQITLPTWKKKKKEAATCHPWVAVLCNEPCPLHHIL